MSWTLDTGPWIFFDEMLSCGEKTEDLISFYIMSGYEKDYVDKKENRNFSKVFNESTNFISWMLSLLFSK